MEKNRFEIFKSAYYSKIRQTLREKINETDYTQKDLAEACEARKVKANQGTISKLLSENSESESIPLLTVAALCDFLELPMNKVLSIGSVPDTAGLDDTPDYDRDYIYSSETLISDPAHLAFRGYAETKLNVYFYPTISYQTELLRGALTFTKDTKEKLCRVTMTIETTPIKTYQGILRISLQQNACYILLSSRELGEISTIFFRHRFFSGSTLKTRLACCNTISAGDARRPTVHRMVIIEAGKELTEEEEKLIKSQLLLNDSQIRISRKSMEELLKSGQGIYEDILGRAVAEESVLVFDESDVLSLKGYSLDQTARAIAELRLASFAAQRYCKSSAKSDELLFKRLF